MRARIPHFEYLALVAFALAIATHSLAWPLGRDQGMEGTAAMMLLRGEVPYRDLWSHSPPGGFAAFALGFAALGVHPWAVRVVDFAFVLGTALALLWIMRGAGRGRAGWLAGAVLLWTYYAHGFAWHTAQRDGLMMLPSALAVALCARERRRGGRYDYGAGVAIGVAALFKPGGVAMLLPAAALQPRLRPMVRVLVGGLAVGVVFAAMLVLSGAWSGFMAGLVDFNTGYKANYAANSSGREWAALKTSVLVPLVERRELAPALLGLFVAHPLRRVAAAWWLAATTSVLLQAALYSYHVLPLLPPLALLWGLGVDHVWTKSAAWVKARRYGVRAVAVVVLVLLNFGAFLKWRDQTAFGFGRLRGVVGDEAFNQRFDGAHEIAQLSATIRERSTADERILLWGADAQVYVLSGRGPATGYPVNLPLVARWGDPADRARTLATVQATPPPFVVISRGDRMPWLHGNWGDSVQTLSEFPELAEYLRAHYDVVVETRGMLLLGNRERAGEQEPGPGGEAP